MCSEVHTMYGAYYPYLYGRAGPSRPFYQYDRVSVKQKSDQCMKKQEKNEEKSVKI